MSDLTRRVLFGVVAAPVAALVVLVGGAALAALLAVIAALAAWEFFRLARADGLTPMEDIGIALAGVVPLLVHGRYLGVFDLGAAVVAVVVLAVFALSIWLRGVEGRPLSAVATTLLGVVYTGGMLSFGYAIRYHDYAVGDVPAGHMSLRLNAGGLLLLLPVVLTWASDTGAYFVGRAVGGRKLIPSVSPAKTVAGAVGGLGGSVLVAWLYVKAVLHPAAHLDFAPWGLLLFGAIISVAAQVGDLAESLLKREAGVKDSSRVLPGHGGILDRFDSLFFVLPVAYLLLGGLLVPAP